jgi:hypothetical protein
MNFGAGADFTLGAMGFFFDVAGAFVGHMAKLQDGAAKYAIILGNDELAVLGSVDFFKVVDLVVFHFLSSLSRRTRP